MPGPRRASSEIPPCRRKCAVGQHAAGVDRRAELETDADERIDRAARRGVAGADRAIARAEAADDVERFQREARRVDLGVARGAGGVGAVLVELLADGRGAAARRVRSAGMFGGGGSGGWPSKRSMTNAPRGTGDVVVPLAVIFRIAACVRNGPRGNRPATPRGGSASRSRRECRNAPPASRSAWRSRTSPDSWRRGSCRAVPGSRPASRATIESCR